MAVGEDLCEDRKCSSVLHVACCTMPQPLGEWLTNKYGADLSAVTEISGVPNDVTGKFLFPRTLKSLYLPTIFELQTAETTNANLLTPLPILRLFRTAGTLDALASCTSLTSVDVSYTKVEGQSARALGLVALNLHCKPPRPSLT